MNAAFWGSFTVAAGVLDFVENHHILAMLDLAEDGGIPGTGQLVLREVLSSMKWVPGFLGFVLIGLCFPTPTPAWRWYRCPGMPGPTPASRSPRAPRQSAGQSSSLWRPVTFQVLPRSLPGSGVSTTITNFSRRLCSLR